MAKFYIAIEIVKGKTCYSSRYPMLCYAENVRPFLQPRRLFPIHFVSTAAADVREVYWVEDQEESSAGGGG